MEKESKYTTLDIHQAAFFEINGLSAELEFSKGRVIFVFRADDQLYALLREFNTNASVKITDYICKFRELKSELLSLKNKNRPGLIEGCKDEQSYSGKGRCHA